MWVTGHSRSLKMVSFQSLGTVSYSPSIVTLAVSLAISEICSVIEWLDLEVWVWGCSDGRTELLYQYRTSVCWRAIKTVHHYHMQTKMTINHWHLWQFSAKRGRPTALPYISHKWHGSCRAVRTDGVAHTDDRPLNMQWQALSCPVLCFSQLVLLCVTCVVINIMHMHEAFHFFLISKNYHVSLCTWIAYH